MADYKMEMQERAEQMAEDRYGRSFSVLPQRTQDALYLEAMNDWHDARSDAAETARDAARDREMGL
jgi:hypothetical protein